MAPFRNPFVLVTRPEDSAAAFVDGLRAQAGAFQPVFAPAFGFEDLPHDMPSFEAAIFTSKAGVATAPDGEGRVAWCVGDATALAARQKGYDARSAQGDAADLVEVILSQGPAVSLLHVRGETSYGDVSVRLTDAGLTCADVVTYRKVKRPPPATLQGTLTAGRDIIIPVFSAETVSILMGWDLPSDPKHIVAISPNVAQAARGLGPASLTVADAPGLLSMTQAVGRLIA